MTENNPFADRLREAAKEGYVQNYNGFRRDARPRTPFDIDPDSIPNHPDNLYATEKQQALIVSLLGERQLSSETRPKYAARLSHFTDDPHGEAALLSRTKASAMIEYLFGLPVKPIPADAPDVPAGRYAIIQDGKVVFLQVDRPTEGKWAGKVFVKIQHGDDLTTMSRAAGYTMLGRIMELGPALCSAMYGRHIGKCGVCGRTLTNEESRAAGIGPKCAGNMGW